MVESNGDFVKAILSYMNFLVGDKEFFSHFCSF